MYDKNEMRIKPRLSAPILGHREIETLRLFWRDVDSPLSANDLLRMLEQQAKEPSDVISINTIQSTIERLWKKSLLSRHKKGKAYIYVPIYSKQEVISSLIRDISDSLGEGDESVIMSGILTFLKSRNIGNQLDLLRLLEQDPTLNKSRLADNK